MNLIHIFASNIKEYRNAQKLSQEKLAELSGLHRTYVSAVERERRNISIDNIENIANALDIEPYKLLMDEENRRLLMDEKQLKEFRDGIFALRTRRFGTVAEIMIKHLYDLDESGSLAFDKKAKDTDERIEVKFSTVMKENDDNIRDNNVIDQCKKANLANRAMTSSDVGTYAFDCNIQQVKRNEFDILYYGLFFADQIEIYRMESSEILNCPGYSDKQHRGNEGEGQFHLNQDNIEYHRKHHLQRILKYAELYNLLNRQTGDNE